MSEDFNLNILNELAHLKRHNQQLQEQMTMIHGAFEELCERQESSHAVQIEFASRMTALHERQLDSMTHLIKLFHGKFFDAAHVSHSKTTNTHSADELESAVKLSLSSEKLLLKKRAFRLRASARHSRRLRVSGLEGEVVFDDAILVLPDNSDVH